MRGVPRVEIMDDEDDVEVNTVPAKPKAEETAAPVAMTVKVSAKACAACGKSDSQMKLCSRCKNSYYCSVDCQKKDFPKHKKICGAKREERKVEKKESASTETLWANHESRLAEKEEARGAAASSSKAKVMEEAVSSRFDPAEVALLRGKKSGDVLACVVRAGDDFDVQPRLLSGEEFKSYLARGETARLIEAAAGKKHSLGLCVAQTGSRAGPNECAARLMTRPDVGFPDGRWQIGGGDVVVFRRDGKHLACADLVFCYDFAGYIISDYFKQQQFPNSEKLEELFDQDVRFKKHKFV